MFGRLRLTQPRKRSVGGAWLSRSGGVWLSQTHKTSKLAGWSDMERATSLLLPRAAILQSPPNAATASS